MRTRIRFNVGHDRDISTELRGILDNPGRMDDRWKIDFYGRAACDEIESLKKQAKELEETLRVTMRERDALQYEVTHLKSLAV